MLRSDRHIVVSFVTAALALIVAASCSTTRRIPKDDQLYTGIKKIVYNIGDTAANGRAELAPGLKDDIREAVFVAPNNYFKLLDWRYPFPLGLWVYNNWPNPPKGLRHWLYEKLVAEPVLVSDVRPEVRARMIGQILDNNGYFGGNATYKLINGRNSRKASVEYCVNTGRAYRFDSIELLADTLPLYHAIDSIARKISYLSRGSRFDTDSLSAARITIANALRNRGYYYFRPEYIEYLADSTQTRGAIQLRLMLGRNIPKPFLEPWITGDVTVRVFSHNGRAQRVDTVRLDRAMLYRQQPTRLRNSVINSSITFRKGRRFSVRNMDRTQSNLSRTGIFSSVGIETRPDTTGGQRRLNVGINCTMDRPLEVTLEVNASSKSNSYLGPGLTFGVTNRNIFGGGEQLSVKVNGSYEWQTGGNNKGGIFNSYEVGITGTLAFPRMLAPKFVRRWRRNVNWTRLTLNADLLNRPHFFKMAQFNTSMSYDWQRSRHVTLSFTPVKLTYTKLMRTTHDFDSIMAENPAVALSFQNQFIPQMMYSYLLDLPLGRDNNLNISMTAQEAGNIFWSIYEACGKRGEKTLFNTPFSQFIKGQLQVVYSRRLGQGDSWLVTRAAVGAAHAYGNSSQVPYAEQFYCGGANSVRAFTVRSIGPGSYRAPGNTSNDYFDQTGTFKFEANIEYRFPIAGILHGAIFLDSGNVWLLKNDPMRPGGLLKASSFLDDLALGTGIGLRADISMLVLRGDLGIGIHAPYDTGKSGYYNMKSFGKSLAFHLAIGYPF